MITASHNPTEFNGIKFSGPDGLEIPPEAERRIEGAYAHRRNRSKTWMRWAVSIPTRKALNATSHPSSLTSIVT
jgi:phosphomannomutase